MAHAWIAVVVGGGLIACGGTSPRPPATRPSTAAAVIAPSPFPPPPAGFATAVLATMTNGVVATYGLVDGKLVETGRVALAKFDADDEMLAGVSFEGAWADHANLFVQIGERRAVQLTASTIVELPVPAAARFQTPRPAVDRDDAAEMTTGDAGKLVVTRGTAAWSACAWGFPYDGFQCEQHVHATLWPQTSIEVAGTPLTPVGFALPTQAPGGHVATASKDGTSISCKADNGAAVEIAANADDDEQIESVAWVSVSPPRLLVIYGHFGLADLVPDRWTLHDACTAAPIATGGYVLPGPDGLWLGLGADDGTKTVYQGGAVVGTVPDAATVMFRPR